MRVIRNVKNNRVLWLFHNEGEPFQFSAVYLETEETLTIRYINPKTKNNYQYDFRLEVEEENGKYFEQWFFTIQKNGAFVPYPKYKELKAIPEPTCLIELILKAISIETLTNFGAPKFKA